MRKNKNCRSVCSVLTAVVFLLPPAGFAGDNNGDAVECANSHLCGARKAPVCFGEEFLVHRRQRNQHQHVAKVQTP